MSRMPLLLSALLSCAAATSAAADPVDDILSAAGADCAAFEDGEFDPGDATTEIDLNGDLIKRGLAFVTRDYVHVTFARYRQFEEEAKRNRRGMWHALPLHQVSSLAR